MEEGKHEMIHTSDKLRSQAVDIIRGMGRPMSANEIEIWLRLNGSELWDEVSKKCEDYVRIILSISQEGQLAKFKPARRIDGIDKRATFFGLVNQMYDPNLWIQISPPLMQKKPANPKPPKRKRSKKKAQKEETSNQDKNTNENDQSSIDFDDSSEDLFGAENDTNDFFSLDSSHQKESKTQNEEKPVSQEKSEDFAKLSSIFDCLAEDERWFQSWCNDTSNKFE